MLSTNNHTSNFPILKERFDGFYISVVTCHTSTISRLRNLNHHFRSNSFRYLLTASRITYDRDGALSPSISSSTLSSKFTGSVAVIFAILMRRPCTWLSSTVTPKISAYGAPGSALSFLEIDLPRLIRLGTLVCRRSRLAT